MFVPVPFRFWKNRNDFTCISLGHYITSFMVGSHAGLLNRTYYRCLSLSGFLAVGRTAIRANSNKGPLLMCRGIFFENEHGWPLGRLSAANGVCRNSNRTGKSMKSTKAELSFDRMALFYHVCIGIISSTILCLPICIHTTRSIFIFPPGVQNKIKIMDTCDSFPNVCICQPQVTDECIMWSTHFKWI